MLQAGAYARGGEVFLLDMGKPLRILDLADRFLRLQGLAPGVDMKIQITGPRPGEKLFEELLIEAESQPTAHPLIYRAQERSIPPHLLWPQLDALQTAIAAQDVDAALELLAELVPEWRRAEA